MSMSAFFKTIEWGSTFRIALIRIGVASTLWVFIFLILGGVADASAFLGMLVTWPVILTVAMGVAIPVIGLSRAGVPYVGLLALPAWLVVIGDPVVRILWKQRRDLVPVDVFKFFNPPVLAVFRTDEKKSQIVANTLHAPPQIGTKEVLNDQEDPVRELLMTCDRSPPEGLELISGLDQSLQATPVIMFGRFIALRHLALDDGFIVGMSPNIGTVTQSEIEERMTEEQLSFAEQALIEIAKIEAIDPDYVLQLVNDEGSFGESMLDDICTVMERRFPGKVQKVLGWTKMTYFGGERLGSVPGVLDEADNNLLRGALGQRIRPPKIALSAVTARKGVDDGGRGFVDTVLMGKDFREKPTFEEADMFCRVRSFSDGEVSLSAM